MAVLSTAQGRELLAFARAVLRAHLHHEQQPSFEYPQDHPFCRPAGAFVTLRLAGRLRGCIGQTEPVRALIEVVAAMAVAAGTRDPRFSAVQAAELDAIDLEAVLSDDPYAPDTLRDGGLDPEDCDR